MLLSGWTVRQRKGWPVAHFTLHTACCRPLEQVSCITCSAVHHGHELCSWRATDDIRMHACSTLAHTYLPSGCRQTYAPDPSTTLAELRQYIEPRVLPHMSVEQLVTGPPLPALHSLGFSAFHGGVCSSVVRSQGEFYNDKGLKTAMR